MRKNNGIVWAINMSLVLLAIAMWRCSGDNRISPNAEFISAVCPCFKTDMDKKCLERSVREALPLVYGATPENRHIICMKICEKQRSYDFLSKECLKGAKR